MKNENKKLPLVLILALPILLMLSTELVNFSFNVFGQPFYLITFIFPLTFFVSILISEKTESKNAMWLTILSLTIQAFVFVIKWVLIGKINYILMEITFLGFLFSQMIALFGYEILKETKKDKNFMYLFLILFIVTIIESMFYVLVFPKLTLSIFIANFVVKIVYDLIIAKILER